MYDVVVIGGGLAGALAALEARQQGARVSLLRRAYGATALSSGGLDIAFSPALSPAQQVSRSIAEHAMDIIAHRPRHPYGVMGLEVSLAGIRDGFERIRKALSAVDFDLGPMAMDGDNLALPSSLGALVPVATAAASHIGFDPHKLGGKRVGVVGLSACSFFDARSVARGITHDARMQFDSELAAEVVEVTYRADASPLSLAARLDDDREIELLGAELAKKAAGFALLVVPPVVGLTRHRHVWSRLREIVDVPLVEALAHSPSVPGLRLQQALDRAVTKAGVDIAGAAVAVQTQHGRVDNVRAAEGFEVQGASFVLATGRFVAGGLVWPDDGRCKEALFGLPVVTEEGLLEEDSPLAVVRETPVESHPLMTVGVQIGRDARPMAEGRPAFHNLFAAGMVVGGFASRYALCSDGVALASAMRATQGALAVAG